MNIGPAWLDYDCRHCFKTIHNREMCSGADSVSQ
jgi:hypothetical protein